jgi:hypothetical protein
MPENDLIDQILVKEIDHLRALSIAAYYRGMVIPPDLFD